jgi:two-component system sensor histidine kinase KdpD
VISIAGGGVEQSSASDRLQVYEAFANLSALAIERVYLNKEASQAQLLKAKEELQSAILNSISHDFRTPLVTITGTLSSLDSEIDMLDTNAQKNLVQQALTEAEKLNRLVGNLLNISRLESGAVHLQLEPVDLQDLIGATLEQMKHRAGRQINIRIPDDLPLISADYVLLQQALMNVIENAIKYSPENTPVDIEVHIERKSVSIGIADRGPGIEEKEISRVFNKFYRINNNPEVGGTGLGLAIVKGIIDAHEASIEVFRREGGGMVFQIAFPYAEFQPAE